MIFKKLVATCYVVKKCGLIAAFSLKEELYTILIGKVLLVTESSFKMALEKAFSFIIELSPFSMGKG